MISSANDESNGTLHKQEAMAFWQFLFLMMLRNTLGVDYVTHNLLESSKPDAKMKSKEGVNERPDYENMPELASD